MNSGSTLATLHFEDDRLLHLVTGTEPGRNLPYILAADSEVPRDGAIETLVGNRPTKKSRVTLSLDVVKHIQPELYNRGCTVSSENRKIRSTQRVLPDWAKRIRTLRKRLGMDQRQFGQALGLTQAAVSKWEVGQTLPAVETWIKIGRMAGQPEAWEFWALAGLYKDDLSLVPISEQFSGKLAKSGKSKNSANTEVERNPVPIPEQSDVRHKNPPRVGVNRRRAQLQESSGGAAELVPIRVIEDLIVIGNRRQEDLSKAPEVLMVSRQMVPNPDKTVSARVAGNEMSPILEDGHLVVIDTSDTVHDKLYDKMVAARDPKGRIVVRWLRKAGREEVLASQRTAPYHNQLVILSSAPGWRIIGRVLFWIGKPS